MAAVWVESDPFDKDKEHYRVVCVECGIIGESSDEEAADLLADLHWKAHSQGA